MEPGSRGRGCRTARAGSLIHQSILSLPVSFVAIDGIWSLIFNNNEFYFSCFTLILSMTSSRACVNHVVSNIEEQYLIDENLGTKKATYQMVARSKQGMVC